MDTKTIGEWLVIGVVVLVFLGCLSQGKWMGVLIMLGGALYFLPSIISMKKQRATGILFLNLFTGWSIVGWVVAFYWACTDVNTPSSTQIPVIKDQHLLENLKEK